MAFHTAVAVPPTGAAPPKSIQRPFSPGNQPAAMSRPAVAI